MGNLFSRFVIKDDKKDFLHSSGYAKVQNEGNVGAASTQSFGDRMEIERNRQRIKGYNDSRIMAQAGVYRPKAAAFDPKAQVGKKEATRAEKPARGQSPKNPSISR